MIDVTDRVVDATYRRGIAALVADGAHLQPEAGRRRIPILVAAGGIAIPMAALVIAAFVVIAGHAQRATALEPAPASASTSGAEAVQVGQTVRVTEPNGSRVDVTVENVFFAAGPAALNPAPANGLFMVADVTVSSAVGAGIETAYSAYVHDVQTFNMLEAQLQVAIAANDQARVTTLEGLVSAAKAQLSQAAAKRELINFEYVSSGGQVYPAWNGNSAGSSYMQKVYPGVPPVNVAKSGQTSLTVVFDVVARGGAIQMIDSQGKVIGRWLVPAA